MMQHKCHATHWIETTEEPCEQLQILVTHVTTHQQEGPIVHANLNGHSVSMQLDTGATVVHLEETCLGTKHWLPLTVILLYEASKLFTTLNSSLGKMQGKSTMSEDVCRPVCCYLQRK